MQRHQILPLTLTVPVIVFVFFTWSWLSQDPISPIPTTTQTSTPLMTPSPSAAEWILIDLPPDATQVEYGAQVYRLVCSTCHGDRGQGLTDEWRATWPAGDQNCWRSKCHAANHPPEGFVMPIAPALVGPAAMSIFGTALDLHNFIQANMPWNNPGALTEKDSWSVTAYIMTMNQIDPGKELDAKTAAQIPISLNSPVSNVQQKPRTYGMSNAIWLILGGIGVIILVSFVIFIRRGKADVRGR